MTSLPPVAQVASVTQNPSNCRYTALLTDMDGVLYRGNQAIADSAHALATLLKHDVPFLCLTNNSGATPERLRHKLIQLGFPALELHHFLTAGQVLSQFIHQQQPAATVYVVGEPALHHCVDAAGLTRILDGDKTQPDYVVVGKTEQFNFAQLKQAVHAIRHGARFIGANPDLLDPVEDGEEPACGSLLAAIAAPSECQPYIVGKPNGLMYATGLAQLGVHRANTLMVGDRMDTDIMGAVQMGLDCALVLSGVTRQAADIHRMAYQPTWIVNRLVDVLPYFIPL
jgi:NagD protein